MKREPSPAAFPNLPVLPHPSLVFDRHELAELRAKRSDPVAEALFQAALDAVNPNLDPADEAFIDWAELLHPAWRTRKGLSFVAAAETMAFCYAIGEDQKYADFAKGIIFAVIRNQLADGTSQYTFDDLKETVDYPGWRHNATHDFGKLMLSLAVYYDFCQQLLSDDERREFVAYAEECLHLKHAMRAECGRMSMNNRGFRCSMGAAMLAMAIAGDHQDDDVLHGTFGHGLYDAEAFAHFTYDLDGAPFEGGPYAANSSTWLILFGRALRRRGFRDFAGYPGPQSYPDYMVYMFVPGYRELMLLNDSAHDCPIHPFLALASRNRNRVARWLWEHLRQRLDDGGYGSTDAPIENFLFYDPALQPQHPAAAGYPLSKHFRGHGVVVAMTGWDDDDARATFFCGRQQFVCHRQEDQGSFIFCALGEKFAWDAGYGDYGLGVGRAYRRSDVHNAILIDGHGQNSYEELRWSRGHLVDFRNCDEWTYALGDTRRCYGIDGSIERADRHWFFKRGPVPYLLVIDDLIADADSHAFTWNFVTHPDNTIVAHDDCFTVQGAKARMQLRLLTPDQATTEQNQAGEMPRLQVTQTVRRARFAALLLPLAPGLGGTTFDARFSEDAAHLEVTIGDEIDALVLDLRRRCGPRVGDERVGLSVASS